MCKCVPHILCVFSLIYAFAQLQDKQTTSACNGIHLAHMCVCVRLCAMTKQNCCRPLIWPLHCIFYIWCVLSLSLFVICLPPLRTHTHRLAAATRFSSRGTRCLCSRALSRTTRNWWERKFSLRSRAPSSSSAANFAYLTPKSDWRAI